MRLLIIEAVFALLLVAGVAAVYWPAALILAGLLGILACERAPASTDAANVVPLRRSDAA